MPTISCTVKVRDDGSLSLSDVDQERWQHIKQAVSLGVLRVIRIDEHIWTAAMVIFRGFEDQDFSFTDCTSFVLAREQNVTEIFTFNHHFLTMRFIIQSVP